MDNSHNRLSTVITALIIAGISLLAVACSPIVTTKGVVSNNSAVAGESASLSLTDNSASNIGIVENTSSMEPSSSGTVINDIKVTDDLVKVSDSSLNSSFPNNSLQKASLMWPLITEVPITVGFNGFKGHTGIDFAVPKGSDIIAVDDGIVITAKESDEGLGAYLIIDHGNGVQTLYAHCDSFDTEEGSTVKKGDIIAASGGSGDTTACLLHFELRIDGKYIDPEPYLIPPKK